MPKTYYFSSPLTKPWCNNQNPFFLRNAVIDIRAALILPSCSISVCWYQRFSIIFTSSCSTAHGRASRLFLPPNRFVFVGKNQFLHGMDSTIPFGVRLLHRRSGLSVKKWMVLLALDKRHRSAPIRHRFIHSWLMAFFNDENAESARVTNEFVSRKKERSLANALLFQWVISKVYMKALLAAKIPKKPARCSDVIILRLLHLDHIDSVDVLKRTKTANKGVYCWIFLKLFF